MFGYLAMCGVFGLIGKAVQKSDERKYQEYLRTKPDYRVPEQPKKPVRYQNKMKQAMYEQYLRDKKANPAYAECKVRHHLYGYTFDDTEK